MTLILRGSLAKEIVTRLKPLILNIDDNEAGRYAVGRMLQHAGFDVETADSGKKGINLVLSRRPDLILLDIHLPDIDGFEVCRRIREHPEIANTPIIQMSASYIDPSSQVRGLDGGADAYLTERTEPPVLIATVRSMLRMKQAEQAVLRAAQIWQSTFDAIGDSIAVLDSNGTVMQSNAAFKTVQLPEKELSSMFAQLEHDGARKVVELRLGNRVLLVRLDPIFENSQRFTGGVCVISDITAKKDFEERLHESARLESLGVMAGGIAHDFNNLLTGILGNASLLAEVPDETNRSIAGDIVLAGERAADLTKQMLAYSGKGRFLVQRLDLNTLIHENLTLLKSSFVGNVSVELELSREPCTIEVDRAQIQQIVMNLLINASEAIGSRPGKVVVHTAPIKRSTLQLSNRLHSVVPPGDYVLFEVRDSGIGMSPETLNRIFDPFFTTKFTGRGLGLAAVLGIVKGHNGEIEVESIPEVGTTFRILLPVSSGSLPSGPDSVGAFQAAGQTVLVVDDEQIVRRMATMALRSYNFSVIEATNGSEALEMLRTHSEISLVILDLEMPVMTGEQAVPIIKALYPNLPILLSSGFGETDVATRVIAFGIKAVLQKPYTVSILIARVKDALDLHK
ncbi:MAG: response regulator [Acidobacteriota bacterium]|nr:response regulator [Acidobacteriota bacterium]